MSINFPVDVDVILDFVRSKYMPEDVFISRDLEEWAENNGYIKLNKVLKLKETLLKEDYEDGA